MWQRRESRILLSTALLVLVPLAVAVGLRGAVQQQVPAAITGPEAVPASVVSQDSLLTVPDRATPLPIFPGRPPATPTSGPTVPPAPGPARPPSPTQAPFVPAVTPTGNRITAPPEGAVVQGELKVKGIAAGPLFRRWRLDLLLNGEEGLVVFLDDSENPREQEGTFERIDTSLFPDGTHVLRLRVFHADGSVDEDRQTVTFANGNTSFVLGGGYTIEGRSSAEPPGATPTPPPQVSPRPTLPAGNGIVAPADGERVSGIVRVRGVADAPDFDRWQLDVLLDGDESRVVPLATGRRPRPTVGTFKKVDTTSLPDGTHVLRLRVVFADANYEEYRVTITVDNAQLLASAPAQNGITAPPDGAIVSGPLRVEGVAFGADFKKWQLDLLLDGDPDRAIFLGRSSRPRRLPDKLTTFDTARYPNGTHVLRLRVVRVDGNYDEYTVRITFEN